MTRRKALDSKNGGETGDFLCCQKYQFCQRCRGVLPGIARRQSGLPELHPDHLPLIASENGRFHKVAVTPSLRSEKGNREGDLRCQPDPPRHVLVPAQRLQD